MPKSSKTATKPEAERLSLSILRMPTLTDRETVRAFVRSERFRDLNSTALWALELGFPKMARHGAQYLVADLGRLAVAAAGASGVPLEVVEDTTQDGSPREYLDALGALAKSLREQDGAEEQRTAVVELVAEIAQRELARKAA